MPELGEQMYCSQQICIPPTFPYLLRQFAKAAIRTQPNDLLKWSTTYFRCLSLNIPPPVKPRLEYPIPHDYHGMTPGWLKALLHQMAGSQTIPFKVLWDRWIGACLQHPNLIQILCLGGFDDNTAIPWLRFIALCAAHLTENLTKTMILVCEVLTEEPEGGSAAIPMVVFVDLYQFLARIDASVPQTLKNYYFLDKFLELWEEKIARDAGGKGEEEESEEGNLSVVSTESTIKAESETRKDDGVSMASCPSITSQDPDNYMKLLMKIRADDVEGELEEAELKASIVEEAEEQAEPEGEEEAKEEAAEEAREEAEPEEPRKVSIVADKKPEEDEDVAQSEAGSQGSKPEEEEPESRRPTVASGFSEQLALDQKIDQFQTDREDLESRDTRVSSVKTESKKSVTESVQENKYLIEDLERLRTIQADIMGGESDDELEKFKASILADAGLTASQIVAPEHFHGKIADEESAISESIKSDATSTSGTLDKDKPQFEVEYEEVQVDAVPGIGPRVSEEMIVAVCNYMREVAKCQHGMVMPRNIRHFECPPLEIYDY